MVFGRQYRPRHISRRLNPILAFAMVIIGAFSHSGSAVNAAQTEPGLQRGFGRLG
jgi:hypothetical protein